MERGPVRSTAVPDTVTTYEQPHADRRDLATVCRAFIEQQRHGVALREDQRRRDIAEHRVFVAGLGIAQSLAHRAALSGRHFHIIPSRQRQQLLRDTRSPHGVARDSCDGAKIEIGMANGERECERVVDVRADIGVEDE